MLVWVPVALSVGLIGASLRMWTDFSQRIRQLNGETAHTRSLVESHTEALAATKVKADGYKNENMALLRERDDLEGQVHELRQQLTALEERLERTRPSSRRVDTSDTDDDIF